MDRQARAGGAILGLGDGRRAESILHYAYGIFPIVALGAAHVFARRPDFRERPWIPFAWVAFICFGLTLRAVMTGLST